MIRFFKETFKIILEKPIQLMAYPSKYNPEVIRLISVILPKIS